MKLYYLCYFITTEKTRFFSHSVKFHEILSRWTPCTCFIMLYSVSRQVLCNMYISELMLKRKKCKYLYSFAQNMCSHSVYLQMCFFNRINIFCLNFRTSSWEVWPNQMKAWDESMLLSNMMMYYTMTSLWMLMTMDVRRAGSSVILHC